MKVLIAVKRVPDGNVPLRLLPDGSGVDLAGMPMRINPFDEAALEAAVQLKESGKVSDIIAVTIGAEACQDALRHALALGADRAIRIHANGEIESLSAAKWLAALARREQADLVLLGKQSSDSDNAQTAPMLAALLGWPQALFASALALEQDRAEVTREIEGGQEVLSITLPAVISADLRLAKPRYLKLPQLLQAKKKPIDIIDCAELGLASPARLTTLRVSPPPARKATIKVSSASELVAHLRREGLQ